MLRELQPTMRERWAGTCLRSGCPELTACYDELDAAYSESHRFYHTWQHIAECLDVWMRSGEEAEHPEDLELSIWIHDAVYRPLRSDNEVRSAELAIDFLAGCAGGHAHPDRVRDLILATRHSVPAESRDEALIQDIDLHILGAPPARYREYRAQVRREYRVVPGPVFRKRRARLLRSFLDGEHVFRTPWFRTHLEEAARENLTAELRTVQRA